MDLLAYIAEVLKGRHELSISLETTYLHFVPSGLSTHDDMQILKTLEPTTEKWLQNEKALHFFRKDRDYRG